MKKLTILVSLLLVACVPSGGQATTQVVERVTATPTAPAPIPMPTVIPSPTLVPTNTPGPMPGVAFGTRENPVPRGQSCLAPSGWQIVVLDFNSDAWPVVQAASPSNQPPAPGNRMVMIRLGTTNVSAAGLHVLGAISFYLTGSSNVLYNTYDADSDCGIVPDKLNEEYFQGSSGEGNVCFEIPLAETDLLLLYEYAKDEYIYFALE